MGRESPPPDQAASGEEFHGGTEREPSAQGNAWSPFWWLLATLLFVTGLIFGAYALTDHHWWLWLGTIAPLAIVGTMALHALTAADRDLFRQYFERR